MANAPQDTKDSTWSPDTIRNPTQPSSHWRLPLQLQPKFWLPLSILYAALAIALEVVLWHAQKTQGWRIGAVSPTKLQTIEFIYKFIPVLVATVLAALWTSSAAEISRIQPYLELSKGDSPPQRSVLLDYSRVSNPFLWLRAAQNRHYGVTAAALFSLLVLLFGPLSSTLIVNGDIPILQPTVRATSVQMGLNDGDLRFLDLSVFLTAAGFAGASVQYNLPDPPFVFGQWSVATFSMPNHIAGNGTLTAQTSAVKTDANCVSAPVVSAPFPSGIGLTNNASLLPCNSTWDVEHNTPVEYEAFLAVCDDEGPIPSDFRSVAFWFFKSQPSSLVASVFCTPKLELWNVTVTMDLATSRITSVNPRQQITTQESILGSPRNGRGYNGIVFDDVTLNFFTEQSQNATRIQLPAAVLQAVGSGEYNTDRVTELTNQVYNSFLKTLATAIYFLPTTEMIDVETQTIEKRIWLNPPAVHVLAVVLLVVSVGSAVMHFSQQRLRKNLRIQHEPGTIAAAVGLAAGTNMTTLLAQGPTLTLEESLAGKSFSLDPKTSKIVTNYDKDMEKH